MSNTNCPTEELPLLIGGQLSSHDADRVAGHVNACNMCQSHLDALSASERWWREAKLGLSRADLDKDMRIRPTEIIACSIDTILVDAGKSPPPVQLSKILESPTHPEMLGRIDEFDIEQKIGQGGMGIVFRGFDRSLNRPVAIKVMAPHLAGCAVARNRFEREARAASAVVHPNVISVFRVNTTKEGVPYMAMALVDGLSLQDYVLQNGPFGIEDVLRISTQIAAGLTEAHRQGVIHRDIKPANVMMEKDVSRIMITDFGLARVADDMMITQSGCLAGTPHYMSPEQVSLGNVGPRSDLFSLGSLIYFIATGREPFQGDTPFAVINGVNTESPVEPQKINSSVPPTLNRIILRLLEKRREDRIASAEKLETLLTKLLAHTHEPTLNTLPWVGRTSTERNRIWRGVRIGLFGAGIILLGILAWHLISGIFSYQHGGQSTNPHASVDASDQRTSPETVFIQWNSRKQSFKHLEA